MTNIIIFSKNRAMQLQALLESLYLNMYNDSLVRLHCLYKAEGEHEDSYKKLISNFETVNFIKENNFNVQLRSLLNSNYVLFLVDDTVIIGNFSVAVMINTLALNPDICGFSLRLGLNTSYCYMLNKAQVIPKTASIFEGVIKYDWAEKECDFGYPFEVSSSLYRTKDILDLIQNNSITNPTNLEICIDRNKDKKSKCSPKIACYKTSVAVSVPLNLVGPFASNRKSSNNYYSTDNLLKLFKEDKKIKVQKLQGLVSNSCHQEIYFEVV